MGNQLNRFQGLSESRWTLPEMPDEAAGGNKKALSQYITGIIEKFEEQDPEFKESLEKADASVIPKSWKEASPSTQRISRREYLKRQNDLYHDLTGLRSFAKQAADQTADDTRNIPLMNTLEMYMAALDEKIYMSADHTRALIGCKDQMVRDEFDRLEKAKAEAVKDGKDPTTVLMKSYIELREHYFELWVEHSLQGGQRDALEVESTNLRYDQALQLAKISRLQYAVHALGAKLVDSQKWRTKNEELVEDLQRERNEKQAVIQQNEALNARVEEQAALIKKLSIDENGSRVAKDVETRIGIMCEELTRLSAVFELEKNTKIEEDSEMRISPVTGYKMPKNPLSGLELAMKHLECMKEEQESRLVNLLRTFIHQHQIREQELMYRLTLSEKHRLIVISKHDAMEKERDKNSKTIEKLEEQLSRLGNLLKRARAALDGTTDVRLPGHSRKSPHSDRPDHEDFTSDDDEENDEENSGENSETVTNT